MGLSLADAVQAARRGEDEGLRYLYAICLTDGFALINAHFPDLPLAVQEDVVQEASVQVFDKLGALRRPESFRAFFGAIVLRELHRRWLRRSRRHAAEGEFCRSLREQDPVTSLRRGIERRVVRELLEEVDHDALREAGLLFYVEGLTRPDIAERLGVDEGAVRTRLFRLRKLVRGELVRRLVLLRDRLVPFEFAAKGEPGDDE